MLTSENPEEILVGHWGFLPSWAKERGKNKEVINGRAESVLEKPYFRSAIRSRRCLIPVTGFFEWKREGKSKTPYRFHANGEIFSLAGLYTMIKDEDGFELPHYAIITTEANKIMAPVHDRIPVIIEKQDEEGWVSEGLTEMEIGKFFRSPDFGWLQRDQISALVNSPKNDASEILQPIPE